MRVKTFFRFLRIISAVVLFFFVWTFGEVWQAVAWAVAPAQLKSTQAGSEKPKPASAAEQFEAALAGLRERIGKTSEKVARDEDITEEIGQLKTVKAAIEALDGELRKEFSDTEKRLIDSKLPKEIRARHAAFVKSYTDNYTLLQTEIDDIDKAKTKADRKTKIEKVRLHIEKTRKKSSHIPIDPNRLPHRAVRAKPKAPRLTAEEYQRDFPKQKSQTKKRTADSRLPNELIATDEHGFARILNSAIRNAQSTIQRKPILMAFNETASDIPFSFGSDAITLPPDLSVTAFEPLLLAQAASDLPTPDDLASTPEINSDSPLIRAKAQELGCAPARLYTWTRNSIEFIPSWGSIQGAEMCLQTKQCNSIDTNSLLAALMRSCNIPARLNIGTIEVPIEKVMNWAGGFSDPTAALNYLASGGIPVTGLRSSGKIYAARLESSWLRVFVDYIPSFGAVHKEGDTFIPLDACFKQYNYSDGVDFSSVVPFDGQALADQIKATATINEQEGYVTNVDSTIIQTAQNDYNAQLENYVNQNIPNATPGDILGKKEIIKKEQPILPASLPYKVVVAGAEAAEIPDSLKHKATIQLVDADSLGTVFTYTISLPQLAGKRFTLSYDPATTADQDTINRYVEEYATSIPAYLIQFKPVLKLENVIVATGPAIGMGSAQNLTISLTSQIGTENVTHNITAGDYTAIGINPSIISLDALQKRIDKNDYSEPVGEMLHQTALSYWAEADAFNSVIAKTLRVNNMRHPSELAASAKVSVSYIWGAPSAATYNRRNIDVKLDNQSLMSKRADKAQEISYMQQSGTNSSFLEGAIFDQLFGGNIGDSISAVTALKAANDQGIPIYRIDSSNVSATIPKLNVADAIKTEISNAVNAGLTVQIPQRNIIGSGWSGVGYIVSNPIDGTGAYRISGGLNGADNNTGNNAVIPLPQVSATGSAAFVLVGLSTNVGTLTATDAGILTGIRIAPWLVGAAVFAALIGIMLAIWAVIKVLVDRFQPEPRWETYRHYTSIDLLKLILATNSLKVGELEGTYGYGVYLTKISVQPDATVDSQGQVINYGPNCLDIATQLGIPIYKTSAYIDVIIDMNRRGVIPKKPPQEYLLIGFPQEVMPFGADIKRGPWYPPNVGIQ